MKLGGGTEDDADSHNPPRLGLQGFVGLGFGKTAQKAAVGRFRAIWRCRNGAKAYNREATSEASPHYEVTTFGRAKLSTSPYSVECSRPRKRCGSELRDHGQALIRDAFVPSPGSDWGRSRRGQRRIQRGLVKKAAFGWNITLRNVMLISSRLSTHEVY